MVIIMAYDSILYPEGWHWAKQTLTYAIDPQIAGWQPIIQEAVRQWDGACGVSFAMTSDTARADITFTTLAAANAPRNAEGWSVFTADDRTAEILHGDVGLPCTPEELGGEARWVALHELGHALGLSHPHQLYIPGQGDGDTVMCYYNADGQTAPCTLLTWDLQAVQALYGADRVVRGGTGDDALSGGSGADLLYGGLGADAMNGGAGPDTLYGGQGDDLISGGACDDVLFGNLGADRFVFAPGEGHDRIVAFNAEQGDRIELAEGMDWTLDAAADGSALLRFADGGTVALAGVAPSAVDAAWVAWA